MCGCGMWSFWVIKFPKNEVPLMHGQHKRHCAMMMKSTEIFMCTLFLSSVCGAKRKNEISIQSFFYHPHKTFFLFFPFGWFLCGGAAAVAAKINDSRCAIHKMYRLLVFLLCFGASNLYSFMVVYIDCKELRKNKMKKKKHKWRKWIKN